MLAGIFRLSKLLFFQPSIKGSIRNTKDFGGLRCCDFACFIFSHDFFVLFRIKLNRRAAFSSVHVKTFLS